MQLPPQIAEIMSLVAQGRAPEAVQRLEALAAAGDGPGCWQLAEWRREGLFVPRDFAAARTLYRRAGQAGLIEAKRRHIALVATGIGGRRDWKRSLKLLADFARIEPGAARQLDLVRKMRLNAFGDPISVPAPQVLSEAPRLVRFPALFSPAECDFLIEAAGPMFERAPTFDATTGQAIVNPVRTSDTAVFPWVAENPAVHALNRRLARASGTDTRQGEPLQVLRYAPGQQYKPHIDAIPGLENQRIHTILVYLNEDYDGGETHFLKSDIVIRGGRGDALLWTNVDSEGRPATDLVHAGLPVRSGVKLLASRWIRAQPITE